MTELNHTCRCEKCYGYRQERDQLLAQNAPILSAVAEVVKTYRETVSGETHYVNLIVTIQRLAREFDSLPPKTPSGASDPTEGSGT